MRLRDQLIRSFVGVGALRMLAMPISLLVSIILARTLGPNQLGQFAFAMAIVSLLALPVANAVPQLLTREVAKFAQGAVWDAYRGILRFSYAWVLGYSLLITVAVWFACLWIAPGTLEEKWQLLPLATLLVPLAGLLGVVRGTAKGLGHVSVSELPEQFLRPLCVLVVIAALALTGPMSPEKAIAGQILAWGIAFAAATVLLVRLRPEGSRGSSASYASRNWRRAMLPLTLVALVATFNSKIAIVLLGVIGSNESVGAFQVAVSGANLVTVSLVLVNMVIAPQIVRFRLAEDRENLQLLSRQSARVAFAIAAPIALAYYVLGEQIVGWLFGAEYAQAAFWPLVIIASGHLFNVFVGSVGLLLIMSDFEIDMLRSQFVALGANLLACAVLIPTYGATGAAIGTGVGLVVWNVLMAFRVHARLGIWPTAL